MAQVLPPNGSDYPLTRLPARYVPAGAALPAHQFLNPKFFDLLREIRIEDAVSIS